jgi:hypothetical protein
MKTSISVRIPEPLFQRLHGHLFPGDNDEHAAVLCVGLVESERGTRLLIREVFLAHDGIDYVAGTRGYRALTARFVANAVEYCASHRLGYLAVHSHQGNDWVSFSDVDMASHNRGYPALLDITRGGPVGALVFAENAVAGDIWMNDRRFELDYLEIVGARMRKLYPKPHSCSGYVDPIYDRHARMYGDIGQTILSELKVVIIGAGGGGSLVNQALAHLGVGHLVVVDFDRVDFTNLPRIVGATRLDAMTWLTLSKRPFLKRLGRNLATRKVHVAERVARRANPKIRFDAVVGDVRDQSTALLLKDADFIFLASDTFQSRVIFNALVYQYMIPGAQIGAKVHVNSKDSHVGDIFTASRITMPWAGGGCLYCHGLIPAARVQEEALTEQERRAQRYVEDQAVAAPSVITLNILSAAQPLNDFMMMFTGLYSQELQLHHQLNFARERSLMNVEACRDAMCLYCSTHAKSRLGRGDRFRLPCRCVG